MTTNNVHTMPRRQVYPWRTTAVLADGERVTEVLPATDSQQAEERLYRRLPAGAQVLRLAAVRLAPVVSNDLPDTIPMPLEPLAHTTKAPSPTARLRALPQASQHRTPAIPQPRPGRAPAPAAAAVLRAFCALAAIAAVVLLTACGGGDIEPAEEPASAPTTRLIDPPRDRSVL